MLESIGNEPPPPQVVALFIGSGDFTGAPKMGWLVAKAFRRLGFRVVAIVGRRPTNQASVTDHLRAENIIVYEEYGFENLLSIGLVRRCVARLRAVKPVLLVSVLQNDFKIAALVSRSVSAPLVIFGQSLTTFYGPNVLRRLKAFMFGFLARRYANLVICASKVAADHYHRVHRIAQGKLLVIPNGIEVEAFAQVRSNRSAATNIDGTLEILNVGRLDVQKGQDILLDAIAMLPLKARSRLNVSFVGGETMGSNASSLFLKDLLRKVEVLALGSSVAFLGWRDNVSELLSGCDLYVHSARWEGLPLAVLEAMASRVPTIYTDCSGALEGFVNGVHGFMVNAGDPNSLQRGLLQMLTLTPEERITMGERARELIRDHYDVSVLGSRIVERCRGVIVQDRAQS